MKAVRVQEAAALRIDEIYRYSRERWGADRADAYIVGLFKAFESIADGGVPARPIPAEFGVEGCILRYEKLLHLLEDAEQRGHRYRYRAA